MYESEKVFIKEVTNILKIKNMFKKLKLFIALMAMMVVVAVAAVNVNIASKSNQSVQSELALTNIQQAFAQYDLGEVVVICHGPPCGICWTPTSWEYGGPCKPTGKRDDACFDCLY